MDLEKAVGFRWFHLRPLLGGRLEPQKRAPSKLVGTGSLSTRSSPAHLSFRPADLLKVVQGPKRCSPSNRCKAVVFVCFLFNIWWEPCGCSLGSMDCRFAVPPGPKVIQALAARPSRGTALHLARSFGAEALAPRTGASFTSL